VSFSVDVNVLLYAADASSPRHARAREVLDEGAGRSEIFALAWPTLLGFLRISTHPRSFATPLSPAQAQANVQALLSLPNARAIGEDEGFWETYRELAGTLVARGNLVPDLHLASLLKLHGVRTLYTNDSDFKRFDFLDLRNPFQA